MSLIDSSFQYQEMALKRICEFLDGEEREREIEKIKSQLLQNIELETEVKIKFQALETTAEKLKSIPDLDLDQVKKCWRANRFSLSLKISFFLATSFSNLPRRFVN